MRILQGENYVNCPSDCRISPSPTPVPAGKPAPSPECLYPDCPTTPSLAPSPKPTPSQPIQKIRTYPNPSSAGKSFCVYADKKAINLYNLQVKVFDLSGRVSGSASLNPITGCATISGIRTSGVYYVNYQNYLTPHVVSSFGGSCSCSRRYLPEEEEPPLPP